MSSIIQSLDTIYGASLHNLQLHVAKVIRHEPMILTTEILKKSKIPMTPSDSHHNHLVVLHIWSVLHLLTFLDNKFFPFVLLNSVSGIVLFHPFSTCTMLVWTLLISTVIQLNLHKEQAWIVKVRGGFTYLILLLLSNLSPVSVCDGTFLQRFVRDSLNLMKNKSWWI